MEMVFLFHRNQNVGRRCALSSKSNGSRCGAVSSYARGAMGTLLLATMTNSGSVTGFGFVGGLSSWRSVPASSTLYASRHISTSSSSFPFQSSSSTNSILSIHRVAPHAALSLPRQAIGDDHLGSIIETMPAVSKSWRPVNLPCLSTEEMRSLGLGMSVQAQERDGVVGSGYVVQDIRGTKEQVWALLTDYGRYHEFIGTVRSSKVKEGSTLEYTRAKFVLSKFLLEVNVRHFFSSERSHLKFSLDPSSTNLITKEAEGYWFVENEGEYLRPGHVRVWFGASVRVSRLVPKWVVDYASIRALRRATGWLRTAVAAQPLSR